ncbi:recombinase family protein [Clostridium botulinum]|nr:recombinase family protein [Clostridium botulinum]NFN49268.1 recombinase family protein [Clostridium botulinum]
MDKAYGYIRVSTENQVKQGYSLDEQREEIIKYCKECGYELIKIFKDEGISGAKANEDDMSIEREGLMDMLTSIKDNNIKYVVVLSTSRLWRSDLTKVLIQRELKKKNIDIKAIDRPNYSIYSNNPNEILVNGMLELLDVYERLEIALKLRRGRLQKARSGGYSGGGVPYGYIAKRGSKVIEIESNQAEAVRRVFELNNMCPWLTLQEIADTLNLEGYKGKKGGKVNSMLIKRILDKHDFYKGVYMYSGIKTEGKHEPII